jgi:hypothetical protein
MNVLLCPTLLFIEDDEWNDKNKKDIFLKRLLKIFDYTLKNDVKIYWNDDLELMLWEQPNLHPWLSQDTSDITVSLFQNTNNIQSSVGYDMCKSDPNIISTISSKDIVSPTLSLIHYMLEKDINFDFIVDEPNNHKFTFSCECHDNILIPQITYLFDDSINISEEISKRWNKIKVNNTILTELLEITRQKYFPDKNFVYKLEYDSSFINSFYKTTDKKEKIIYTIVQRLTLKPNEVAKVVGLHDEQIKTKSIRSFRINDVCRVYYEYKKDNTFLFKNYTGSSEHDKGTRHT